MSSTEGVKAVDLLSAVFLWAAPALAQDFHFDSSMSRPVLENSLDRSISFTELLHDDLTQPRNARGVDPRDNLWLILSSKAKLVGRALMAGNANVVLLTGHELHRRGDRSHPLRSGGSDGQE
jgi:hypothetical protein